MLNMKKIKPPKEFWFVQHTALEILADKTLLTAIIGTEIEAGNGVLYCQTPKEVSSYECVIKLGVAEDVRNPHAAKFSWCDVEVDLFLDGNKTIEWNKQQAQIKIDDATAERLLLADLFMEQFSLAPNALDEGGFLYLIQSKSGYKFGVTDDLALRNSQLRITGCAVEGRIVHACWYADPVAAQRSMQQTFEIQRIEGEWFALAGDDLLSILRYRE